MCAASFISIGKYSSPQRPIKKRYHSHSACASNWIIRSVSMQFSKCFLCLMLILILFQIPGNQPLQWECPGQAPGRRPPAHDEAGLLRLPAPPRGAAPAPLRVAARAGGDPRPAPRPLRPLSASLRPQRPGRLWQTGQWSSVISMFITTAFFNRKRLIWIIAKQGLSLLIYSYFHDLFSEPLHSGKYLLILCWLRSITVQFLLNSAFEFWISAML